MVRPLARSDHLSGADLVAYDDGALPPRRRARIEAHLAACAACRRRLAADRGVGPLVSRHYLPVETPTAWQTFADRLAIEERRSPNWRRRAILAPLAVLLLLAVVAWPAMSRAAAPLEGAVRVVAARIGQVLPWDADQTPVTHVAPSRPGVTALPFRAVEPPRLPLGLRQVERSTPGSDRLELLYRNSADLAIRLIETPDRSHSPAVPPGASTTVLQVDGTQVRWLRDPRPNAVAGLMWERQGVFFELMVVEAPPGGTGGLKLPNAIRIVETLMAAQGAALGG